MAGIIHCDFYCCTYVHLCIPSFHKAKKVLIQHSLSSVGLKSATRISWGFPGGAVVESLPANAGFTGSSPGLGGSHMPRSGWAREPQLLSLRIWSLCSETGEAVIVGGPRTAMRSAPASRSWRGPLRGVEDTTPP